jgi:hypothetical protein
MNAGVLFSSHDNKYFLFFFFNLQLLELLELFSLDEKIIIYNKLLNIYLKSKFLLKFYKIYNIS